ncbi:MAG TPA: class II glutamine amidotransferase, partial [Arachnia sp.]|nr:class II glutamine amidotransferase [Arachnia sp.]
MCGIVGYLGNRSGLDVVLSGLRRLEYRGYDSAGVAVPHAGGIEWRKRAGKIVNLDAEIEANPLPESSVAIGHTRWATHGAPTDQNSHPHVAERIAIVHNGIIENHDQLRGELPGVEYRSETDSEVAAHLLRAEVESGADLTTAMRAVVARLEGAFTLVAVDALDPDRIVAARRNS